MLAWTYRSASGPQSLLDEFVHEVTDIRVAAASIVGHGPHLRRQLIFIG